MVKYLSAGTQIKLQVSFASLKPAALYKSQLRWRHASRPNRPTRDDCCDFNASARDRANLFCCCFSRTCSARNSAALWISLALVHLHLPYRRVVYLARTSPAAVARSCSPAASGRRRLEPRGPVRVFSSPGICLVFVVARFWKAEIKGR